MVVAQVVHPCPSVRLTLNAADAQHRNDQKRGTEAEWSEHGSCSYPQRSQDQALLATTKTNARWSVALDAGHLTDSPLALQCAPQDLPPRWPCSRTEGCARERHHEPHPGEAHQARAGGSQGTARTRPHRLPPALRQSPRQARHRLRGSQGGGVRARLLLARLPALPAPPTQDPQGLLERQAGPEHGTRCREGQGVEAGRLEGDHPVGVPGEEGCGEGGGEG